jgi:hypothetical protein
MPIAVIQAVNKGVDGAEPFTKNDEEALSIFSAEVENTRLCSSLRRLH